MITVERKHDLQELLNTVDKAIGAPAVWENGWNGNEKRDAAVKVRATVVMRLKKKLGSNKSKLL